MGAKFIVETDHAPLIIFNSSDTASPRLQRWSLALRSFSFIIKHIPGKDCVFSDFLSRHVPNV